MKYLKIFLLALIVIFSACNPEEQNENNQTEELGTTTEINKELLTANNSASVIADSIMYITNVINPDPTEEYYMKDWLGGAKTEILANHIFKAVYEAKLKPYDYSTGEELTIEEVQEIEKEHSREHIGQILFTEDWYFDETELKMYKQVNSIMLAYYRYDEEGNIIGNKAGIRVYLNDTKPMRGALDY